MKNKNIILTVVSSSILILLGLFNTPLLLNAQSQCSADGFPPPMPSAPANVVATAGNASASISFTAQPVDNAMIRAYKVISNPGNITVTGESSPIVVTGLTNGVTYTFTVKIMGNIAGCRSGNGPFESAPSAPSNKVTPTAPPNKDIQAYSSVVYTLSPTTRTITNPLTHKAQIINVTPDYTCTPYMVETAWEGQLTYAINYGASFSTKADAINATLTSLRNCLNIAPGPAIGTSANYVGTITGVFRTQNYDPVWAAYGNNLRTKSVCAANPVSRSYLFVSNANTCTLSGSTYNGSSRQVDYASYLPEIVHLRSLWCYNSTLSGCTIKDAVAPTYRYNGDLNLQISAITNGFKISWDDLASKIGAAVNYSIYKKGSIGSYALIKNSTDTSFSDTAFDHSQTQYYEVTAYNSNNSFINIAFIDSSSLPNSLSTNLTISGSGFTPQIIASSTISLKISLDNPNYNSDPNVSVPCSGFQYQDSKTLVNGVCNIDAVNDPSGSYDVVLSVGGKIYTLPDGFTITYPPTIDTTVQGISTDVSDGYLKIKSVQGSNLNTLSIIGAQTVDGLVSAQHYVVGSNNVDSATKTFSCTSGQPNCTADGYIKIYIGDLLSRVNGDLSKIYLYTAGDLGSIKTTYSASSASSSLQDLGVGCTPSANSATWIRNWTPAAPSNVCPVNSSTAVDNCGVATSTPGTLSCTAPQTSCNASTNKCVCTPLTKATACTNAGWECGNGDLLPDGCGGTIDCGNCSYTCYSIGVGRICEHCDTDHKCH